MKHQRVFFLFFSSPRSFLPSYSFLQSYSYTAPKVKICYAKSGWCLPVFSKLRLYEQGGPSTANQVHVRDASDQRARRRERERQRDREQRGEKPGAETCVLYIPGTDCF